MLARCLTLLSCFLTASSYPVCKNQEGSAVPFWFLVKAPKGTDSLYYDASQSGFVPATADLNSTTAGALATTMKQLWLEQTTDYLVFNDEPPTATNYNFSVGHTKGVWAWNVAQDAAIVLQHSTPKFPLGPGQSSAYTALGGNAWMYGQHFACFSLTVAELAALAPATQLTVPAIYDSRVRSSSPAELQALASGQTSADPVCSLTPSSSFHYYAKSSQWNNELYAACIAGSEDDSLLVESWIRGSAEGPSCSTTDVLDVQSLAYPGLPAFTEYNDHSKWAVSATGSLVCASDINRMTTQYTRGGSAFCFNDTVLASALRAAITATDSCPPQARGIAF
jgi:deoxyribonuclease-2